MQLKNDFSTETRNIFAWNYTCWWCGRNHANALHHIKGRSSNSPLNACPINNNSCHIGNGKLATFEVQTKLLEKTFNYLMSVKYSLTAEDKQFIKINRLHYEQFISKQHINKLTKN